MKEMRLLIWLLKSVHEDIIVNQDEDFVNAALLDIYNKVTNIEYYFKFISYYKDNVEKLAREYEITYKKLHAKYTLKEYQNLFNELYRYIIDGRTFNLDLVDLLLATLFCLGRFDLSAKMYAAYYDKMNDPNAMFYHGLSLKYMNQNEEAKLIFVRFIDKVKNDPKANVKYLSLMEQANRFCS